MRGEANQPCSETPGEVWRFEHVRRIKKPLPASKLDANSWAKGTFGRLGQAIEPLNPGSSPSHRGTSASCFCAIS